MLILHGAAVWLWFGQLLGLSLCAYSPWRSSVVVVWPVVRLIFVCLFSMVQQCGCGLASC